MIPPLQVRRKEPSFLHFYLTVVKLHAAKHSGVPVFGHHWSPEVPVFGHHWSPEVPVFGRHWSPEVPVFGHHWSPEVPHWGYQFSGASGGTSFRLDLSPRLLLHSDQQVREAGTPPAAYALASLEKDEICFIPPRRHA